MIKVIAPNSGIQITKNEVNLVKLLAFGDRPSDIGLKWKKSPRTIEAAINNLRSKTGTKTAAELVSFFYIHRLLEIPLVIEGAQTR